jgi:GxxExxY protein
MDARRWLTLALDVERGRIGAGEADRLDAKRRPPARALRHGLTREVLEDRTSAETIDAAYAVHEALGSWHDAASYKSALALELSSRGLAVHRDATLSVVYRQKVVGAFPADLLVDERVLVLVRADLRLTDEPRTETVRGLVTGSVRVGLVFNFGLPELFFSRVV